MQYDFEYLIEERDIIVDGAFIGMVDLVATIQVDDTGGWEVIDWSTTGSSHLPSVSISTAARNKTGLFWSAYLAVIKSQIEGSEPFRCDVEDSIADEDERRGIVRGDANDEHRLRKADVL